MPRLILAALVAASALMIGGQSHAGGSTSVLITNQESGRAAALYYTDPRYAELNSLLEGSAIGETRESAPGGGTGLTVSWLAHDVHVWRTDYVVLDGRGDAWVSTRPGREGAGERGRSEPVWRAVADGERMRALVSSLGLVGGDRSGAAGARDAVQERPSAGESPSVVTAPPARPETRWFTLGGWRWVVPGLLVGLLCGMALRRRVRDSVPRQELVDLPPERASLPG